MNSLKKCASSRNVSLFNWKTSIVLMRNTSKIAVEVDNSVVNHIENKEVKVRQHPGIVKSNQLNVPKHITNALLKIIGDFPIKPLIKDCEKLNSFIKARHPPPEQHDLQTKMKKIIEEVDKKLPREQFENLDDDGVEKLKEKRNALAHKRLAQRTYAWKPITYGKYEALVYAIGRGAQEYAVLMRIMRELHLRDKEFMPRSFFDFGSGIGTAMWAASAYWKDSIFEYFNVESSREMNELSELILRDGNDNQKTTLRNVYYRQFLPGVHTKYDLVVSSYSLFELSSAEQRKEVLLNLWRKCDGYLVIVEEGTRRGFELIDEARTLLIKEQPEELMGHVFAPCAHDLKCPRLANKDDNTPCNFEVNFAALPISDLKSQRFSAKYSYVVLKKGLPTDETRSWPRLVRPTLLRSKHAICRMCTAGAKLQEVIFTTSKHGKVAYKCAKASRWGDRLPIALGGVIETKETKTHKIMAERRNNDKLANDDNVT